MYTVLHWQENADDSGYTFKESETKWYARPIYAEPCVS